MRWYKLGITQGYLTWRSDQAPTSWETLQTYLRQTYPETPDGFVEAHQEALLEAYLGVLIYSLQGTLRTIWGVKGDPGLHGDGHPGTAASYRWLQRMYGITEEEDVRWQRVVEQHGETPWIVSEEAEDDQAIVAAPLDVIAFLEDLWGRCQPVSHVYEPAE
jgi:hypothetical protein